MGMCLLLLSGGTFSFNARSTDCTKPVQPLQEGVPSPCTGYLFSPIQESEAYKSKELADLRQQENEILEKRLQLYITQTDALAKDIGNRNNMEGLYRFGYFALGAIVTGIIAKNVSR